MCSDVGLEMGALVVRLLTPLKAADMHPLPVLALPPGQAGAGHRAARTPAGGTSGGSDRTQLLGTQAGARVNVVVIDIDHLDYRLHLGIVSRHYDYWLFSG